MGCPTMRANLLLSLAKTAKMFPKRTLCCVWGYTVCNDFSARCMQAEDPHDASRPSYHKGCKGNGGQFSYSKSLDTHCPLGPAMVPVSELGDGSGLQLTTWVNNETVPRQNASTSTLIFGVKKIVSFISTGMTIEKGSVFCTGTPDGVGDTMKPPYYMKDGDVVRITIDKIGPLENPVSRPAATAQAGSSSKSELLVV